MRLSKSITLVSTILALAACNGERAAEASAEAASEAIEAIAPATEPAAAAAAIPASGESRMDGYGTLRFGMSANQARAAWNGNTLEPAGRAGEEGMACHHLSPAGQATPAQLAFMFEGDAFVRYSVESDEITAPGGGRVGMDEATLQGLYGQRLEAGPHKYVEGGKVLESPEDSGAQPSRLVFELGADGGVSSWRVGLEPQVGYVEGCS